MPEGNKYATFVLQILSKEPSLASKPAEWFEALSAGADANVQECWHTLVNAHPCLRRAFRTAGWTAQDYALSLERGVGPLVHQIQGIRRHAKEWNDASEDAMKPCVRLFYKQHDAAYLEWRDNALFGFATGTPLVTLDQGYHVWRGTFVMPSEWPAFYRPGVPSPDASEASGDGMHPAFSEYVSLICEEGLSIYKPKMIVESRDVMHMAISTVPVGILTAPGQLGVGVSLFGEVLEENLELPEEGQEEEEEEPAAGARVVRFENVIEVEQGVHGEAMEAYENSVRAGAFAGGFSSTDTDWWPCPILAGALPCYYKLGGFLDTPSNGMMRVENLLASWPDNGDAMTLGLHVTSTIEGPCGWEGSLEGNFEG